jgi:predicted RNA-binding Zn-ribbon protein involved in translation (DUF1610 family)
MIGMKWPKKLDEIETSHLTTFRPSGTFPKALWVHVRWTRWIEFCAKLPLLPLLTFQTLNIVGVPWFSMSIPSTWLHLSLFVVIASTVVARRMIRRSARQFGHQVRDNDFMNCLECGYSLRGLPDEHHCPECGHEYFQPDVQIRWRDFLGDA